MLEDFREGHRAASGWAEQERERKPQERGCQPQSQDRTALVTSGDRRQALHHSCAASGESGQVCFQLRGGHGLPTADPWQACADSCNASKRRCDCLLTVRADSHYFGVLPRRSLLQQSRVYAETLAAPEEKELPRLEVLFGTIHLIYSNICHMELTQKQK